MPTPVIVLHKVSGEAIRVLPGHNAGPIVGETLPVTRRCLVVRPVDPLVAPSFREQSRRRKDWFGWTFDECVTNECVVHDHRVVAGLVHDAFGVVG